MENNTTYLSEEEILKREEADRNYETLQQAQQMLYQFINSKECEHEFDLGTMYPALWDKMIHDAKDKIEESSRQMIMALNKLIEETIENEKVNPVQAPEDRPIQKEEDKEANVLFIDPIPLPEHRRTAMNCPDMKLIHLRSDFYDAEDPVGYVLSVALDKTREDIEKINDEAMDIETFSVYSENATNYKELKSAIIGCKVSLNEIDQFNKELTEITDSQFAEMLIWNIFEMPAELKEKIDMYNAQMANIMNGSAAAVDEYPLRDEIEEFIDGIEDSEMNNEFASSLIATVITNNVEGLFSKDKGSKDYNDFAPIIANFLIDNDDFRNAIINRKISKVTRVEVINALREVIEKFDGITVPANFYAFQLMSMFFK